MLVSLAADGRSACSVLSRVSCVSEKKGSARARAYSSFTLSENIRIELISGSV